MTVGSTPSSYWLSLCQWGLIEFWEACLGPQFESKPTVPQFPLPQVFCGPKSERPRLFLFLLASSFFQSFVNFHNLDLKKTLYTVSSVTSSLRVFDTEL